MKTALVTGASGGIGYQLSKLLAQDKYNLVLVARNQDRLEKVAQELRESGVRVDVLVVDLALATAAHTIYKFVRDNDIILDVLINNAGFGNYGPLEDSSITVNLDMILTNVLALTQLTQLFLPSLKETKGKIMNVSSLAGFLPVPNMAIYAATKAYVLSFSEALAEELAGTGVTVTALCPGVTESGFQAVAKMEHTQVVKKKMMTASEVAKIGYRGMLKGKRVVVPGLKEKLMATSINLAPRRLVTRISKQMIE